MKPYILCRALTPDAMARFVWAELSSLFSYGVKFTHCLTPDVVLTYGNCFPIALFPIESGSSLWCGLLNPWSPELLYKSQPPFPNILEKQTN